MLSEAYDMGIHDDGLSEGPGLASPVWEGGHPLDIV